MQYGLIGRRLSHSYSKIIHELLGYPYELIELESNELKAFFAAKDFNAINVTIPYKTDVMPYLDEISDKARKIGSVNTIVKKSDGSLYGYNTDYDGFVFMLDRADISIKNKKVLIFGSGGTSKTALAVCNDGGAREVIVVSRSGEDNYDNIEKHADAEIIINTTPVGMYPNNGESPVSLDIFTKLEGVVDVIYNPLITELLYEAKCRNLKTTNGLPMLCAQAVYASNRFFEDCPQSRPRIEENNQGCLEESITKMLEGLCSNIVLIGMPGSGKSSIGKALAEQTGREFFDTDTLVERMTGMSNQDYFHKYGEAAFREKEALIAKEVGKKSGVIISTGGGIVKNPENVKNLKQNGKIVLIERDMNLLSTEGRPLSKDLETLKKMYVERLPLYEAAADIRLTNEDSVESAAQTILKLLEH